MLGFHRFWATGHATAVAGNSVGIAAFASESNCASQHPPVDRRPTVRRIVFSASAGACLASAIASMKHGIGRSFCTLKSQLACR